MSHYETFVVRLWITDDSSQGHGEVRHLATGRAMLFQKLDEATRFIESTVNREPQSVEPDISDPTSEGRMINFGATSRGR